MATSYALLTRGVTTVPVIPEVAQSSVVVIVSFTAGAAFMMWLGEEIDQRGVGNGGIVESSLSVLQAALPG